MRLLVQHHSRYEYPRPAALGPHLVRLRPATHAKATIETYSLDIEQPCAIRWQQDPSGNRIARITFHDGLRVDAFDVRVEMAVDIRPVNPFDFFVDIRADKAPFEYPDEMRRDLAPFLGDALADIRAGEPTPLLDRFLETLPRAGKTVPLVIELNRRVNQAIRYVIREEAGIWTPEETLANGRGSCRDSAVLLIAALRSRGFAARFVSGYLIQLTDEGMIPGVARGVSHDVVDLHAWAEVFLPGAGWIGLDATSGLFCGEGHIPLVCTAFPPFASPIEGTSDVVAERASFELTVTRLGHEPRPTTPYEEPVWKALLEGGDRADARLKARGVVLTVGGEPTFNARDHVKEPEWNEGALGPTKWTAGLALAQELKRRLAPGGVMLHRSGKHYPGESLPRWALDIISRKDGEAIWADPPATTSTSAGRDKPKATPDAARRVAGAIARRLGAASFLQAAFEDPWRFLQEEASLPVDVDPMKADLDDAEERRRLARILDRGVGREAGWVLPIKRVEGAWRSERWVFRRGQLFLIPGDSPIGLRLPLRSLSFVDPALDPVASREAAARIADDLADPRTIPDGAETMQQWRLRFGAAPGDEIRYGGVEQTVAAARRASDALVYGAEAAKPKPRTQPGPGVATIRTALTVEARGDAIYVFLPPFEAAQDFLDVVAEVDAARRELGVDVLLEGYPPPSSPLIQRFAVTPDPGVLEVNLPPVTSSRAYAELLETTFDAALHAGLHCEKYLVDGRQQGSGGGNHLTFGGPATLESPFLRRPDLLGSLVTFFQHHPSLSYMFTGLFVGPSSQAPRIDEARHDGLYELEIALRRAFAGAPSPTQETAATLPPPWLSDALFRHLLADVTGNTHRTEISIDKLFSPEGAHGRQGLIELRGFEMPPHFRMAAAQVILVRSLLAAFESAPYQAPLARHGQTLHDKYLLPFWMWRDFEDVLAYLGANGIDLPPEGYRPFIELRCPVVGELFAGDVQLEVRNALEPWLVLGEEASAGGTSRFVDSSVERIEVRADGLLAGRHAVLVNGQRLPLRPTGKAGEFVGGVRFRAWTPPRSLHPHVGVHHPLKIDVLDTWGRRSLGACGYHVWHPEGRGYDTPPLTRFEAAARRAERFTIESATRWPVTPIPAEPSLEQPYTLDLRRFDGDHPPPPPTPK